MERILHFFHLYFFYFYSVFYNLQCNTVNTYLSLLINLYLLHFKELHLFLQRQVDFLKLQVILLLTHAKYFVHDYNYVS